MASDGSTENRTLGLPFSAEVVIGILMESPFYFKISPADRLGLVKHVVDLAVHNAIDIEGAA
ncbi:MAG: hypothetical protein A2V83_03330 [Nitrospirae bacterium RBG_16_64_22]|nr:MAG: hypothetical protein A2V83_03330 [Nitrospirae bacterium RBG_16_64_22]